MGVQNFVSVLYVCIQAFCAGADFAEMTEGKPYLTVPKDVSSV